MNKPIRISTRNVICKVYRPCLVEYEAETVLSDLYNVYQRTADMTDMQACNMNLKNDICYEKSLEYWADIPPTVDGVLGGFGFISSVDIDGSKSFLNSIFSLPTPPASNLALDCGAGIGRITKYLLIPHFQSVDVVEPDGKFINAIQEFVGNEKVKLGKLYNVGLQEFHPEQQYDLIWNQWVLGYLTDNDLISFLIRCRNTLGENGVIVVKENVTSSGKPEKDETDSSITRSLKQFLKIFRSANLKRIKQCKQTNFPNGIYPVYMFALVPMDSESTNDIKLVQENNLHNEISAINDT